MARIRKDRIDMRQSFVKEMDELAYNLAGAVKRLPSNMLTEKIDAFKALTQYANTINRTPVSEEGNAIDQFREALGVAPGTDSAARRSAAGPASDDSDADYDDGDDEPESEFDDDAESADAAQPESPAGVPSTGDGAGSQIAGADFSRLRHSVRLPDDQ